jgi:uncharacterized C2H2 Zn-finger protein
MSDSNAYEEVCDICEAELTPETLHECDGVSRIVRPGVIGSVSRGFDSGIEYCKYCWTRFPRTRELNKHLNLHLRPYKCEECGEGFAEKRDLSRHVVRHKDREVIHHCPKCDSVFGRIDNLNKHLRKYH